MYSVTFPGWIEIPAVYSRTDSVSHVTSIYLPPVREIEKWIKWCSNTIGKKGDVWEYDHPRVSFNFQEEADALAFTIVTGYSHGQQVE